MIPLVLRPDWNGNIETLMLEIYTSFEEVSISGQEVFFAKYTFLPLKSTLGSKLSGNDETRVIINLISNELDVQSFF